MDGTKERYRGPDELACSPPPLSKVAHQTDPPGREQCVVQCYPQVNDTQTCTIQRYTLLHCVVLCNFDQFTRNFKIPKYIGDLEIMTL